MSETKPTSDQIRFKSSITGEHILDDYIEACERGGLTIADLFNVIFNATGEVNPDFIEFRLNESPPGTFALQYRTGQFVDPEDGWATISDPVFQTILTSASTGAATATAQAVLAQNYAAALRSTSTTSLPLGTGTKIFTTQADKQYAVGVAVIAASAANPTTNYMTGIVTGYTGTTLTVSMSAFGGSGTYADWNISVCGIPGVAGAPGAPGAGSGDMLRSNNLSDVLSVATARGNLGLGTYATLNAIPNNTITGAMLNSGGITSAQLRTALSDETGTGAAVFADSPALAGTPTAPTAAPGTSTTQIATTEFVLANSGVVFSHIAGFLPSSIAGATNTASLTVSAGQAASSANAIYITKNSTTSWSVTNGNAINGYQGGSTLPNNSTIHFFICSGTSGVGTFASTSLTPTLPSGYNTHYRRIFSIKTNGSGAPIPYAATEIGGGAMKCYLATEVLDYNGNVDTTGLLTPLSTIPAGVKMLAKVRAISTTSGYNGLLLSSPEATNVSPTISGSGGYNATAPGFDFASTSVAIGVMNLTKEVITDTSAQIRLRSTASITAVQMVTSEFTDFRR